VIDQRPVRHLLLLAFSLSLLCGTAFGEDWPTYGHDSRRSGVTSEELVPPLVEVWVHRPKNPPQPAWPPPARADFWHGKSDLNPRVTFDRAYHVAAAGDFVFFGSSADDKIYSLDAGTGEERWSFFTDGPVRLAPCISDGRLYAGSDDGSVYCLDAATGRLLWRYRPSRVDRCVPGNERMISAAPVRTGVIVEKGTAYFCSGLFPTDNVRLVALDARTGKLKWEKKHLVSPQGYMLGSKTRLYVPTGRTAPAILSRKDGSFLGTCKGSVGAWALVTGDDMIVHGPGDAGHLGLVAAENVDHMATFRGTRMIVRSGIAYLLSKTGLSAFDRVRYLDLVRERRKLSAEAESLKKEIKAFGEKTGPKRKKAEDRLAKVNEALEKNSKAMGDCTLWERSAAAPFALIAAGGLLYAGGEDRVAAFRSTDGLPLWEGKVDGRAHGLAVANGSLLVSTDKGTIHCFRGRSGGPDRESAGLTDGASARGDGKGSTEADRKKESDTAASPHAEAAQRIVAHLDTRKGYCLVVGCGEGRLAREIARLTEMRILCVDSDRDRVDAARRTIDAAGLYGTRITVHHADPAKLPYPDYFANLIVSDSVLETGRIAGSGTAMSPAKEIYRLLRPWGGLAVIGQTETFAARSALQKLDLRQWSRSFPRSEMTIEESGGLFAVVRRGALEGAGEWTHMYADAGNTACSEDVLVKGPLEIQWFGRPGPRLMIDRHHRNVPPLFKAGRLFVPADDRVICVDAYNGTRQYDLVHPGSRRLGIFLDTSHIVLDDTRLFVAYKDRCEAFDAATGEPAATYLIPQPADGEPTHWSYVAREGGLLLGSGRIPGASYTETSRTADEALWYDNMSLVTSRHLFALDTETGKVAWTYRSGVIINTTLTVGEGRIHFLESHSSAALANEIGRMQARTFLADGDNFLTAIDLASGRVVYRRKIDLSDCRLIAYLGYADGMLVLSGCRYVEGKLWYFIRGLKASSGKEKWKQSHDSGFKPGGGHGEQNRHPTIVGDTVYTYPYAYRLKSGKKIDGYAFDREGHGCGGVSASAHSLFWRGGNPTMRDLRKGGTTSKINLVSRPGCWLNIIPAGGLVMIPEASSGCTCGFPIQTSLIYRPRGD